MASESLEKNPLDRQDHRLVTITSQPAYINANNVTHAAFSGTCTDPSVVQIKIEGSSITPVQCLNNLWSTAIDFSPNIDGRLKIEFQESTNQGAVANANILKDTLAPTAALVMAPPSLNNLSTVDLEVVATSVDFYSYKFGSAASTTCQNSTGYSAYIPVSSHINFNVSLLGDTSINFCLLGKDTAGNEQPLNLATQIQWTRDATPPTVVFVDGATTEYINSINSSAFNVSVTCSENGRDIQISAKDSVHSFVRSGSCQSHSFQATFDLSTLNEGVIDFSAVHSDAAGNSYNGAFKSILKDTIGPVFSLGTVNHPSFTASLTASPSISWSTAVDASTGSGFKDYRFAIGTSASNTSVTSFRTAGSSTNIVYSPSTPYIEGTSYFATIRAYDNAGNYTEITDASGWKPDITGPTIASIDDGTLSSIYTTPITTWSAGLDSGSGVDHYEYAFGTITGGQNILSWTSNLAMNTVRVTNPAFMAGNTYYMSVRAIDAVGNVGPVRTGDGFLVKALITRVFSNRFAHVGLTTNSKLISWGDNASGGDFALPMALKDTGTASSSPVTTVVSTPKAFAALMGGAVYTWGDPDYGGDSSAVAAKLNTSDGQSVSSIVSTDRAFAALRGNGSVVAWGVASYGGDTASVASALDGSIPVVSIKANRNAFAAIRADGSVITWGSSTNGGNSSAVAVSLNGTIPVTEIASTSSAFAAIRQNGSVITWGNSAYGGTSTSISSQINGSNAVISVTGNEFSFAAIRTDGSIVSWGNSAYGGDSSAVSTALNGTIDVKAIYSNAYSFAALRQDGSVITWGEATSGGNSTSVATALNGSIPVTAIKSTDGAYAAIRNNGSVIVWGDVNAGGNASAVSSSINGTIPVTAIEATDSAFAARRQNGSVIIWGNSAYGGYSGPAASSLTSTVTKLYANAFSFVAIHDDGTFNTWGDNSYGGNSSSVNP